MSNVLKWIQQLDLHRAHILIETLKFLAERGPISDSDNFVELGDGEIVKIFTIFFEDSAEEDSDKVNLALIEKDKTLLFVAVLDPSTPRDNWATVINKSRESEHEHVRLRPGPWR